MNTARDPVLGLRSLGYTEREAAFLYVVGVHSGYFLRRQFMAFLQREDGAIVQRFLKKAVGLGHVQPIAYQRQRHIYHLKARPIYDLLGEPDSQNRRDKGDSQIKARLMQLDYVIEHLGRQFLETGQQKAELFHRKLGMPLEYLPHFPAGNERDGGSAPPVLGGESYFPDRFPISVTQSTNEPPLVTFAYIDEGLRTISAFAHWLDARYRLLRALLHAEVVYVSDSEYNFADAEHEFLRRFPPPASRSTPKPLPPPLGVDHLIHYLRARRSNDSRSPLFSEEREALAKGYLYQAPEFQKLVEDYKRGVVTEHSLRVRFAPKPKPPVIRGHVLVHDYPVWSVKYRRGIL